MATRAAPRSRYLDRPYRIVMSRDGRGARARWIASVEELPGCQASGATAEEAASAIQLAMQQWIADALERGEAIPAPAAREVEPGPVQLDVPHSLKVALTEGAVRTSPSSVTSSRDTTPASTAPVSSPPWDAWRHSSQNRRQRFTASISASAFPGPSAPSMLRCMRG